MRRKTKAIFCFFVMGILILDTKTVLQATAEGIDLCVKTVIPALFPFVFLSTPLTAVLLGTQSAILKPLGALLRLPRGSESIWLVGALGGYPVGARCIGQAVKGGVLSQKDGKRMLCFCSNAGPSFIFGMGMAILEDIRLCFLVWLIHIISAFVVALLTPGKTNVSNTLPQAAIPSISEIIKQTVSSMAMICSWVIVFRILITLMDRWLFWCLTNELQLIITGLLELTNGCCRLQEIQSTASRFMIFSLFLSFGGLCVTMQTAGVIDSMGGVLTGYLPAKITQAAISLIISSLLMIAVYPNEPRIRPSFLFAAVIVIISYRLTAIQKNILENQKTMMYNGTTLHTR